MGAIPNLSAARLGIGSHTRMHCVLLTVAEDQLDAELPGSREDIEAALGQEVRAIAYDGDVLAWHGSTCSRWGGSV